MASLTASFSMSTASLVTSGRPNFLQISLTFCPRPSHPILICSFNTCLAMQPSSCCFRAITSSVFSCQILHLLPRSPRAALTLSLGVDWGTWSRVRPNRS